jgi:hypothetical protein
LVLRKMPFSRQNKQTIPEKSTESKQQKPYSAGTKIAKNSQPLPKPFIKPAYRLTTAKTQNQSSLENVSGCRTADSFSS